MTTYIIYHFQIFGFRIEGQGGLCFPPLRNFLLLHFSTLVLTLDFYFNLFYFRKSLFYSGRHFYSSFTCFSQTSWRWPQKIQRRFCWKALANEDPVGARGWTETRGQKRISERSQKVHPVHPSVDHIRRLWAQGRTGREKFTEVKGLRAVSMLSFIHPPSMRPFVGTREQSRQLSLLRKSLI